MSILSKAVKIADKTTKSLGFQAKVTLGLWKQDEGTNAPTYKTVANVDAIVQYKQNRIAGSDGELLVSECTVTFTNPTTVIRAGDDITFDGKKNVVKSVTSPVDKTGKLMTQAYL